ncbi:MAG: ankyrin repeat domain-containing protein [Pyrinomonadaceae bacterium]
MSKVFLNLKPGVRVMAVTLLFLVSVFPQNSGLNVVSDIPFTIELKESSGMISSPKYYIFLEKEYFNRENLRKIFKSLSPSQNSVVTAKLFTDRQMLLLEAKADKVRIPDYPNTPKGRKAWEDLYSKLYAHPRTGYSRASYSNNGSTEYFLYSPQVDNLWEIIVMIKSTRKFEITDSFLIEAVKDGYLEGVEWYLSQSKRVNIKDGHGITALMYAVWFRHLDIARCLIESGAIINEISDQDATTAIIYAGMSGDAKIVELLIANKANIESNDKNGRTVLMAASNSCAPDAVKLLLTSGSKINRQDFSGKSAISYACENKEVLSILDGSGANPNLIGKDGKTSIFFAIENLQLKKVEFLLEKGAVVNIKDNDLRTPMSVAANLEDSPKKEKIIQLLKQYGAK